MTYFWCVHVHSYFEPFIISVHISDSKLSVNMHVHLKPNE